MFRVNVDELPIDRLRAILHGTERVAGADSPSARALRTALRRREDAHRAGERAAREAEGAPR